LPFRNCYHRVILPSRKQTVNGRPEDEIERVEVSSASEDDFERPKDVSSGDEDDQFDYKIKQEPQ
jgi:hypothetical protein